MTNSLHHLILASNSPRRQELLRSAGFSFEVFIREFDEQFPASLEAARVAEFLARQKNMFYRSLLPEPVIITADTTVVLEHEVLNKPNDREHAFEMLRSLSDKTHLVISGVCISSARHTVSFSETTEVVFHPISADELDYYVSNYRPYDKAGAYGIQEWIGLTKVKELRGSFYNVMGLPVNQIYHLLRSEFGITPQRL